LGRPGADGRPLTAGVEWRRGSGPSPNPLATARPFMSRLTGRASLLDVCRHGRLSDLVRPARRCYSARPFAPGCVGSVGADAPPVCDCGPGGGDWGPRRPFFAFGVRARICFAWSGRGRGTGAQSRRRGGSPGGAAQVVMPLRLHAPPGVLRGRSAVRQGRRVRGVREVARDAKLPVLTAALVSGLRNSRHHQS